MRKIFFYGKMTALTAFAMTAGAGCCYHIMAEPAPYIMPVDTVSYELETFSAQNETPKHENETFHPEMITVDEEQVAPVQPIYDIPLQAELQHGIRELADRYEVSFELVLAVIMTESSGRPDAIGDSGDAVGLMQIQPQWWQELADRHELDLNYPPDNVECGILIILQLLEENDGRMDKALTAYNCGNPDNESNGYFERVLSWMDELEKLEMRGVEHDC